MSHTPGPLAFVMFVLKQLASKQAALKLRILLPLFFGTDMHCHTWFYSLFLFCSHCSFVFLVTPWAVCSPFYFMMNAALAMLCGF